MRIITLYRFKRGDGGITVSPVKPDVEYTELMRLVADEGKSITEDEKKLYKVIDVESDCGWYEVDTPEVGKP